MVLVLLLLLVEFEQFGDIVASVYLDLGKVYRGGFERILEEFFDVFV